MSASLLYGASVLVTGGSRGLGLLLAREFARRGCAVTAVARDSAELAGAQQMLAADRAGPVTGRRCDVRDAGAVSELVADTAQRQGGLDVVILNAGVIQVGPAEAVGKAAFRDAVETMFFGAVHVVLEALPHLRQGRDGGRLGIIGSVGGLVPVPHLVPYSCAKSAVGALAEGLRAEHPEHGVSVTEVHPGLMRTGSHLQAEFGGDAAREYGWFATLAGLPGLTMDAERAAGRIASAVTRRRRRLVLTPAAQLGARAHGLAPVLVSRMNAAVARVLPDTPASGSSGAPTQRVKGHQVADTPGARRSRWQVALSALNERASRRFNETRNGRLRDGTWGS